MKKNKTVLITGSSRGIGKGIALEFARQNFNVVINCNKSVKELENTLSEMKMINENVISIVADVSNYDEVTKMFKEIDKKFGSVDILVNNAGVSDINLFNLSTPKDWQYVINSNLYSVLNCTHLALENMIKNHKGSIINISSIWGTSGASCESVYSASKGAVNLFTKSLAKELAPSNIRVNAIACGVIDTKMNAHLDSDEREKLMYDIPMGKFGEENDIAKLTTFLASDDAKYITGQIITVDGGYL